ncbi:MAG: 1-acyl-sn-glycerol-3-phosphate acyltransferase, partial [Desulfatitalea sp.]|nr:1-acyl-sn-glycerol-3-phosphate acyltransferase [Desulfatitalea sp.]
HEILPKGKTLVRRGDAHIVIRPPIDTAQYTRKTVPELMVAVRSAIVQAMEAGQ